MRIALVGAMSVFIATTALAGSLADQLIGHWQASHEGFLSDYVIQNDGTFTGYLAQDGKTIWTCAGKWDLNGKTVNTVLTRPPRTRSRWERKTDRSSWKSRMNSADCACRTEAS